MIFSNIPNLLVQKIFDLIQSPTPKSREITEAVLNKLKKITSTTDLKQIISQLEGSEAKNIRTKMKAFCKALAAKDRKNARERDRKYIETKSSRTMPFLIISTSIILLIICLYISISYDLSDSNKSIILLVINTAAKCFINAAAFEFSVDENEMKFDDDR